MLMQNFGVRNKEHYGMLWYFLEWSIVVYYISLGGGVYSYLRSIGMGHRIEYGFRVPPPLNRVLFLPLLALCCRCDP